jgi:hypothetical protein
MVEYKKSGVQILDELCDKGSPIYITNNFQNSKIARGRQAGDILIGLTDKGTKRRMTLAIPKNSIVCVSDQISHINLKENPDIRRLLGNGVLEIYTPDEFNTLREEDPDYVENSQDQLERLMGSLEGNPIQEEQQIPMATPTLDITVRPEIQTLMAKVQFESETEKSLIQELRLLAPFSEAEKQNLLTVLVSIPPDRSKLRQTLQTLDSLTAISTVATKTGKPVGRPKKNPDGINVSVTI